MNAFSALEKVFPISMFLAARRPVRPRKARPSQGLLPIFAVEAGLAAAQSRPAIRNGAGRPAAGQSVDRPAVEVSESVAIHVPAAEDLFDWVGENMAQIRGHARKYLAYSPYEMEEFVQQAYETALQAREDCLRKGAPTGAACFEKMFWSSFRITCIHMTYTRGKKLDISHEEYQESGDEDAPATRTPAELMTDGQKAFESDERPASEDIELDDLPPAHRKAFARQVLALMTPKERRAWEYHLAGKTHRQTARIIGTTRQGVQNLLRRGLKRARRLAVPADFRPQFVRPLTRPRSTASTPAQHYLPVIEKMFPKVFRPDKNCCYITSN